MGINGLKGVYVQQFRQYKVLIDREIHMHFIAVNKYILQAQ